MRSSDRDEHELRLRVVIQAKSEKGQNQLQMYLTDDSNPYIPSHTANFSGAFP